MKDKRIKYIGFYDTSSNQIENRNSRLPATNKMDYIISTLVDDGYFVDIISPSWTVNKKFYKGKKVEINTNVKLKLFSTLPWYNRFFKLLSVIFSFSQLFFYLLFKLKKNEQIIVYHSRWMSLPILVLKIIKRNIIVILEVEEIYNDVKKSKFWEKVEYRLFEVVDKYIFPTELLNRKLNPSNKDHVVIYGSYKVEPIRYNKFNDEKIHVLYAGTFDPRKGVNIAVSVANYLSSKYHIHILGFGTEEEKKNLRDDIDRVSNSSNCLVTYDGLLSGEDYIKFLQKCHIGLSPQILNAEYNETSFPSKILSYLTNGLEVVSVKIKSIEMSKLNNSVYFYDGESPKDIAQTIMSIEFKEEYENTNKIEVLDRNFRKDIKKMLGNLC